jgi:hypothetical protein
MNGKLYPGARLRYTGGYKTTISEVAHNIGVHANLDLATVIVSEARDEEILSQH